MSVEVKNHDVDVNFTVDATAEIPTTGQWLLIAAGTGPNNRTGRTICAHTVQFQGFAYLTGVTGAATIMRIMVIRDSQANGAAATVSDIVTNTSLPLALMNLNNEDRFEVLHDVVHAFNSGADSASSYTQTIPLSFDLTFGEDITYSGTAGAITTLPSENIFIIAGTDGASDDIIQVAGTARVLFTDA